MTIFHALKAAVWALAATIAWASLVVAQDRPAGGRPLPPQILRLFDRNGDGKLNAEEEARFREDLRKRQAGGGQAGGRPAGRGGHSGR